MRWSRTRFVTVVVVGILVVQTLSAAGTGPAPAPRDPVDPSVLEEGAGGRRVVEDLGPLGVGTGSDELHLFRVEAETAFPDVRRHVAVDPATGRTYDLTEDLPALLADAGADLSSRAEVRRVAALYAELADPGLLPQRSVLGGSGPVDDALGPQVQRTADGWQVELSTWSRTNGVHATWTLTVADGQLRQASWTVTGIGVGPFRVDLEAPNLRPGVHVVHRYDGGVHRVDAYQETDDGLRQLPLPREELSGPVHPVATRTNFDGSRWVAYYPEEHVVDPPVNPVEVGEAVADGGAWSYAHMIERSPRSCAEGTNPNASWGLEIADPDCELEIQLLHPLSLLCIACVTSADGRQVRIYIAPTFLETLQALGYYTNGSKHDIYTMSRNVIAHEFMHTIQYHMTDFNLVDGALSEGQARFIQTLVAPAAEQDPSSLWYADNINGVNYFQANPAIDLCGHSYSYAGFWGYLYWQGGGTETFARVLEALADDPTGGCEDVVNQAVSAALAVRPGAHDDHAAALSDFARHAWTQNLSWSTPQDDRVWDWSRHLDPAHNTSQDVGEERSYDVGAFGMNYVRLPVGQTYFVTCRTDDPGWAPTLMIEDGDLTERSLDCGTPAEVDATGADAVTLRNVRLDSSAGSYDLNVSVEEPTGGDGGGGDAPSFLYDFGFESGLPDGWVVEDPSGSGTWGNQSLASNGSNAIGIQPYGADEDDWLVSASIDLTNTSTPRVSYWQWVDGQTLGEPFLELDVRDFGRFAVTTDGGQTWTVLDDNVTTSPGWERRAFNLSAYSGEQVRLGWHWISDGLAVHNGGGWIVDQVRVREA